MRISYNGIITAFQAEDASSILAIRSTPKYPSPLRTEPKVTGSKM